MLTIKVNGREEQLSIGCRTFISLDVLLRMLESKVVQVTLNGKSIDSHQFGATTVNSGDSLLLK